MVEEMKAPKYSFIMPAYKDDYLKEALESILAQTYSDFELIIVNDKSPKDLKSIIDSYNDARIRYYENEENIGGKDLVAQWNKCLSLATGEFVVLATDDDSYSPLYLEKLDALTLKYPECDAFRPRVARVDGNGTVMDIDAYLPELAPQDEFLYFFFNKVVSTGIGYWMFRRSRLEEVGGYRSFPAAWFADYAIAMLMSEHGVANCDEILFYFRIYDGSLSGRKNNSILLNNKLKAGIKFKKFAMRFYELCNCNKWNTVPKHKLADLTKGFIGGIFLFDVNSSYRIAIINNIHNIIKLSHLSKMSTIKYIIKRVLCGSI